MKTMPLRGKEESLQRLAAAVAGKRKSLENAIRKLAAHNYNAGTGAAKFASQALSELHDRLVDAEIDRLGEAIRRLTKEE